MHANHSENDPAVQRASNSGIHQAIEFLRAFDPDGRHALFAIYPDENRREGRVFAPGAWWEMSERIAARDGRANLYFSPNEPTPDAPNDKLAKAHIARVRALYADLDPAKDADVAEERRRLAALVEQLGDDARPTFLVDSGSGLHLHWRLADALPAGEAAARAEDLGRGIAHVLGGDRVQNVDRIMRLPGTLNLPDAAKRARGRVEARAAQVGGTGETFTMDGLEARFRPRRAGEDDRDHSAEIAAARAELDMSEAEGVGTLDDLAPDLRARFDAARRGDERLAALWTSGEHDGEDRTGSGRDFALAAALRRFGGFSPTDFACLLMAWEHASDPDKVTERHVARTWGNAARFDLVARFVAPIDEAAIEADFRARASADPDAAIERASFDFGAATRLSANWAAVVPPKEFTLGTRFQPGMLTLGIGAPGVSKSTFAMLSALAIASGKALTGEHVNRTGRVLIYAGEEPLDEMQRRLAAAARFHRVDPALVADRVRLLSGPDQRRLIFAERKDRSGPIRPGPDLPSLASFIRREGIVHAVLDPLIGLHRGLAENESTDMEALGDQVRLFARVTGISVDLIHHARKGGADVEGQAGVADAARGSGAIVALVRSAYTLTPMGPKTAENMNVPSDRASRLVRLDDAKRNNTRRAPAERWFEIVSVAPATGAVIPDGQFDSANPAAFREALESVGVHAPFDGRAARHGARVDRMMAEEGRAHEARVWLLGQMGEGVLDRTDAVRLYRAWRSVGETAAREMLDRIVPTGLGAAVDVTDPDDSSWRLWREQRAARRGQAWVIRRERIGQDVRGGATKIAAGVFE